MKRKKIAIISLAIALLVGIGCVLFFCYKKRSVEANQCSMNDIINVVQPIYASETWANLCEKNDIEYSKETLTEVEEKYQLILNNTDISNGTELMGYLFAACSTEIDADTKNTIIEKLNTFYEKDEGLYSMFVGSTNMENKYLSDVTISLECARKIKRYDIASAYSVDKALLEFYNKYTDTDNYDETMKSNLINTVYYFWEKNKCAEIDLDNEITKKIFTEIYNKNYERWQNLENWTLGDVGTNEFVDVCNAIGIDTGNLGDLAETWNILDLDESVWNFWQSPSLLTGMYVISTYYEVLINGNSTLSSNQSFTEAFGQGLGTYCKDVLIPELDLIITKYNME